MQSRSILFAVSLIAVALAGCASDPADGATVDTPTVTPDASPSPATATPEPSPSPAVVPSPEPIAVATPTPDEHEGDGHDDGDGHHDGMPPMCEGGIAPAADVTPTEKAGYPELVFTVAEPTEENACFSFVGPTATTAGWTAVTLQNNGMAPHIMPMFFIGDKTEADVMEALASGEEPEWLVAAGGVGFATPFSSGTVLMDLQEGNYLMLCFIDGHFMQGMWGILAVAPAEGDALPAPVADLTFVLADYNFTVPENITAGTKVVAFSNEGTEDHEAPLVRLNEGATLADFIAAMESGAGGPPPGTGVGGINVVAPGATAYAIVDFEPATYGMLCFVESAAHDDAPHMTLGMTVEFTVAAAPAA